MLLTPQAPIVVSFACCSPSVLCIAEADVKEVPQMDSGPITVKKPRIGGLKKICFPQKYESLPGFSCVAGLYSCQWDPHQQKEIEPGQCCCEMRDRIFTPVFVAAFCLTCIFLYMWVKAKNDYHNFDWYNYNTFGSWFLWSKLFLVVAALLFSYLLLLLILAMCLVSASQQVHMHWSHKFATVFALVISIAVFVMITLLWTEEWKILRLSFQITSPYLHVAAIVIMVLFAWPVSLHVIQMKNKVLQVVILGPYLAILCFLFFIPLGLSSPCIREKGTLGPKPALIGHRGAPMVAPENTEMSFQKAIDHGAAGLETDVTISYDGVPFLMHDKTLKRTTNVQLLTSHNINENAAMFTWNELEQLNSGEWFLEDKQFMDAPALSPEDKRLAENQSVYKFSDFLKLANQANKLILFDLYRPPVDHPYRDNWINRTIEVLQTESGIKPHLVLWLEDRQRSYVQSVAPGFQHTLGTTAPVEELQSRKIGKLNLDYRDMSSEEIWKYAEANITTNFYVVSEPWLFSLAWCSGAHSVTTNAVHALGSVTEPSFLITPAEYKSMWITADVLGVILIGLIFGIQWWRLNGGTSTVSLENGTYNQFRTELNKMPSVA
ncbi:glycerophosphodiester phosphodiesterase domain-containing protein 4 isoform X2 [Hemicordylus capensis]|uniref:glycerophosphodiester phosphodiesterase domain-containing protein 4 isoform X2 n=1 Tax=Hemicordylus capensis TaxID=884348 RepID=UPI00230256B8|nr:glycerophosphodiester phosphodiesterase domain-containing protein 4 isoform X2 [Hemicordylus capensis]